MFGAVFILQILQKGLLVLGSIGCPVLRINIHSLVPLSERSPLPKRIKNICRNAKHSCCWSYFSVVLGQLLSSWLHSEELVFLPRRFLLSQGLHHAIHVIEHVIVYCDDVMKCDGMPLRHGQGSISKSPPYFHDILHNRPFILSCEKWPVLRVF